MKLRMPKRGKHAAHRRAPKQEKETASRLGGTQVPGSGSQYRKGDVRIRGVAVVECKTTSKKSFSVTKDMLRKVEDEALGNGEVPVLQVEFISGRGAVENVVYVMPKWAAELLLERGAK